MDLTHHQLFALLMDRGLRPRRAGANWLCLCPAHDDRTPSLSIRIAENGRLLAYCHAGCTFTAVVSALGLIGSGSVRTAPKPLRSSVARSVPEDAPNIDGWPEQFLRQGVGGLDASLGMPDGALASIGAGWSERFGAVAAPMRRHLADSGVIGVRLRAPDGRKFSVLGSCNGLFTSSRSTGTGYLWMPEGMTDSAALAGYGFDVAGRPSANGGMDLALDAVLRAGSRPVVVLADKDQSGRGLAGARRLASILAAASVSVRVVLPPNGFKDVREWVRDGGTPEEIAYIARHTAPEPRR